MKTLPDEIRTIQKLSEKSFQVIVGDDGADYYPSNDGRLIPFIADEAEAPSGYSAVLKKVVNPLDIGNYCNHCDWRKNCQNWKPEYAHPPYRCMAISRNDGCSVVFKLNAAEQSVHLTAFGEESPASNPLQMSLFAEVSPATFGGR